MSTPDETGAPVLTVVVVTYNSAQHVEGFLQALPAGLAGVPYQLVVVDNDSADQTVPLARKLAEDALIVETGRNAGYAAGINAGVAAAGSAGGVLILNADVRLLPGCAAELTRAIDEGAGIAVPHLVDGDGALIQTMRREPSVLRAWADALVGASRVGKYPLLGEMVTEEARYERPAVVDWAEGSTVLVGAATWARCGDWDESFFLYSEETEYALRARDAGFTTRYVPTAHAVHLEGESQESPGLWRLLLLNRVRLFGRRHSRPATAAYWAALVVREGSRALLGKRTSRIAFRALLSPAMLRRTPGPDMVRV